MLGKRDISGWFRFGLAALLAITGTVLFVFRSQASQDLAVQQNESRIKAVEKAVNGSLEVLNRNILALSAQVSKIEISIGKIETMQAVQGEDIRELKEAMKER